VATYDREQRWPRWSGTLAELQQATERAVVEIQQWTGKDPATSIMVVERGGLTVNLDQPSELSEAVDPRDLSRIDTLTIEVGSYGAVRVEIRLDAGFIGEGARLRVRGDDRTRVEGLARHLADVLTPRHAVGIPGIHGIRAMFAVFGGFILTLLGVNAVLRYGLGIDRPQRLWITYGSSFLVGAAVLLAVWAGPPIEVLQAGQRSRYVRWRARLAALALTVIVGIATSIIATAIYSGD
jgi:hypothetical protein